MKTTVFAVSDFSGETAAKVAKSAVSQFPGMDFKVVKVPGVIKITQLNIVIRRAKKGPSAIFYTLVDPELRGFLAAKAGAAGIPHFDVFGPALDIIDDIAGEQPILQPGPTTKLDMEYFNWVDAVQFAVRHDDGTNTATLNKADIVLIGVSRTGKTPLTIYMAYRGWKVANVPIIYGLPLPNEIHKIDKKKIIGLTINAKQLTEIRHRRVSFVSSMLDTQYAAPTYIHKELRYSKELMNKLGCRIVDVSGKAVEEIAQEVTMHFKGDTESLV
jgi:regulator of PEP synthase PpsR (kinase-PPPase family)